MKISRPLVVMDLETTGTWIEKDRIIEIAMIRYAVDGSKETYLKRVNPEMPIPAFIEQLTGIKNADVKSAPKFREIAAEVLEFIGENDVGGFNVERFDLPLLERQIFEAGLRLHWRDRAIFDAQKIYHYHEKRDLTAAYQFYCNKELVAAHTALADTEATAQILNSQLERYGEGEATLDCLKGFDVVRRSDYFDKSRKFRWWNGELYPMFGKYARRLPLKAIKRKDVGYLQWILKQDFSDEVKDMIQGVLQDQFPVRSG